MLEWICATSAEVEVIGDARPLGSCALFSLPGKLHICLAPGCVEPAREPQSEPEEQTDSTEFGHEQVCPHSCGGRGGRLDRRQEPANLWPVTAKKNCGKHVLEMTGTKSGPIPTTTGWIVEI